MTQLSENHAPDARPPFSGHVVHVVDHAVAARWEPMLRQVLWALAESGPRIALLTNDEPLLAALDGTAVNRIRPIHIGGWRGWRLPETIRLRCAPPPMIAHVWGAAGERWCRQWARETGAALVVHAFDEHHIHRLARRRPRPRHRVLAAAKGLTGPLLDRWSLNPQHWETVAPAVGVPLGYVPEPAADRTLGIACVGMLGDPPALGVVLDALAQLRSSGADLQAVLIGEARHTPAAWRLMHERRVHECCVVIDEPHLWEKGISGADVCVVPARQTDLWLAPLLAMGLGKIVIASRDQLAEWFIEGRTSWQFTPGSAVELAYLLMQTIEKPKLARDLRARAADYFYEHHGVGTLVDRLLAIYQRLATEGAPRPPGPKETHRGS